MPILFLFFLSTQLDGSAEDLFSAKVLSRELEQREGGTTWAQDGAQFDLPLEMVLTV